MSKLIEGLQSAFAEAEFGFKHAKEWGTEAKKVSKDAEYFHACYKNVCEEIMTILSIALEAHNNSEILKPNKQFRLSPRRLVPVKDRKIAEYACMCAPSNNKLTEKVGELMLHGYQPLGGVSISSFYDAEACTYIYTFCQAMVKYE